MTRRRALLFDLDDTLIVEEPAAAAAFAATAASAGESHDLDAEALAAGVRNRARELWHAAPTHDYCRRVGISSWEGLWCSYEGEGGDLSALREWAPTYRTESWRLALGDLGVDDPPLAGELADRFIEERRSRHAVFPDVAAALTALGEDSTLALVTNGASCLQREKLAASGLAGHFAAVVVSADLDTAKPDAAVFRRALAELGVEPAQAVMVGDSIRKDVDGALGAGLGAVWLNRSAGPAPEGRSGLTEISSLAELESALGP